MFLSDSPSKVYALQYREQLKKLKSSDSEDTSEKYHPLRKVLKFLGKVTFFEESSKTGEVTPIHIYPDELKLALPHVATLISSLRYEQSVEIDLLEVFTHFLTQITPNDDVENQTEAM